MNVIDSRDIINRVDVSGTGDIYARLISCCRSVEFLLAIGLDLYTQCHGTKGMGVNRMPWCKKQPGWLKMSAFPSTHSSFHNNVCHIKYFATYVIVNFYNVYLLAPLIILTRGIIIVILMKSHDCLIFTIGFWTLVRQYLSTKTAPWKFFRHDGSSHDSFTVLCFPPFTKV